MSFIAVAIGAAAAIGGAAISADASRRSAHTAADANRQNTMDTNATNLRLFNLSRGAAGDDGFGHSILPDYFNGNEQDLGQQAYANFQRLSGLGENAYGNLQNYQDSLRPAVNANLSALNGRYNGQDLTQRLQYSSPFYVARANQANTYATGLNDIAGANSSAINSGMLAALGQINAQRASQGYLGNSTFDRNRLASATLGARQAAAVQMAQARAGGNNAISQAGLDNAADIRGLQFNDMDFKTNSSILPAAMQAYTGFENAPISALANNYTQAQSPLNFFRIQPQAFQQQNLPMVEPSINGGMIFGSALSQAGQALGSYGMMSRMGGMQTQGSVNPYTSASYVNSSGLAQQNPYSSFSGASVFNNPYGGGSSNPYFNYSFGR